jgi:membrane-associated phospholipid phosphatase
MSRFPAQIARVISWVGHPLVFVSVTLGIVVFYQLANRVGLSVLLAMIIAVVFPTGLLLVRGVRSGRWSDVDVSVQEERIHFYPRAILLSGIGVAALLLLRAPGFIVRGALVTLVLLAIAGVINRYLKVSLHTLFAFYCAVALFRIGFFIGLIALIVAILVVWSRLHLRRHAFADVLVGALLGSIGAFAAAWWH